MLNNIITFVSKFKEYFTFLALSILCLALISIGNTQQISGFRSTMIVFTAWLQNTISWLPNPTALKNENKALRNLNLKLSEEVSTLRAATVENARLREKLSFYTEKSDDLIPAEIVGRNSIDLKNYITLDKGYKHNVNIGMSVRTDAGLVGIIIGCSNNYSIVELLNNNNTKIAATILRTGINGIFTWNGGDEFTIKNIPISYDVKKGDIVVTSNFSNKYPNNIPIGVINSVEVDNKSIFHKINIKSYANLRTIEEVFIVKTIANEERKKLIEEIEKKIYQNKSAK